MSKEELNITIKALNLAGGHDAAIKVIEEALAKPEHGDPLFKEIIDKHEGLAEELAAMDKEQGEPVAWSEFIERACGLIKAADDAAADRDYMLDSDDCISVLRGTWKGNYLNDHPQPKQEQGEPVALKPCGYASAENKMCRKCGQVHAEAIWDTTPQQRKPLTDDIWILTSEYNDYDQHGEYFEAVFIGKPTAEQIEKQCEVNELGSAHILAGGGRVKWEDHWYNLRKEKAAHGIKD